MSGKEKGNPHQRIALRLLIQSALSCLMRYAYQAYGVIQHIPVGRIRRSRRIRQDKAHQINNLRAIL